MSDIEVEVLAGRFMKWCGSFWNKLSGQTDKICHVKVGGCGVYDAERVVGVQDF